MDGWSDIELTAVATTGGNLTQLFPNWVTNGSVATTQGSLRRQPCGGFMYSAQIETDSAHGGEIEIWDLNGEDVGANVNTAKVVTDAQLVALQALNRAKLLWSQKFAGTSSASTKTTIGIPFLHGLAARFKTAAPAGEKCWLNLVCDGGFRKVEICGV